MVKEGTFVYQVSELTSGIRTVLESSFSNIWVEGEISNFKSHSSGHFYFTLKDDRSELKCTFFKNCNVKNKFEIQDGMQVICFGRVSVFEKRGQYQMNVIKMEPKGVGALQLAFEQLKERLFKEGLFDQARKRPIPMLPNRIGIVTSPTGAAIRDMLHVLDKRFSNVEVVINPVKVQGQGAKEEIVRAIEGFNKLGNIDVMIVGRGGGSLEDLWAFNEEIVARAIHASKIPVISAVGHEIDWTISDFVADLRAPTPSVAAERAIANKGEIAERLENLERRLKEYPLNIVKEYEQRLDDIEDGLSLRFRHYIEIKEGNFRLLSEKLEILSPLGILGRGYSISFKLPEGKVLKDVKSLKTGDMIETRLSKGNFRSRVE
ncbi:MAG: exodeoxyribonuclease VII large subunit [Candidatus Gorgyraea atricola]|nr:exodeoxyribonuclease VII large subunit [Candidatus Gorgyraea atricola]